MGKTILKDNIKILPNNLTRKNYAASQEYEYAWTKFEQIKNKLVGKIKTKKNLHQLLIEERNK